MPQGPGTYGSKRGRPPKKKNKNIKKVMSKPAKKKKLPKRGQRAAKNKRK
jgi:hypothetical protein